MRASTAREFWAPAARTAEKFFAYILIFAPFGALAAPNPTALSFIGYGQSTMQAPGTTEVAGASCTFSTTSGGQVAVSGLSGAPFSSMVPGAVISAAGIPPGSNPTITGFISGASGGRRRVFGQRLDHAGPGSAATSPTKPQFMQLITGRTSIPTPS